MNEKDIEKAQRLNEAYKHLFAHHGVGSQKHLAEILKIQRTGLSAAFNGSKANLTKNLFMKICASFPGVFNLDYFLTGNGTLLTAEEDVKSSEIEKAANRPSDQSAAFDNLIEIFSRVIRESDDLRVEMKTDMVEIRALKEDLHQAVYDFRDATYRLTQALKSINGNNATVRPLDMAAEDETTPNK